MQKIYFHSADLAARLSDKKKLKAIIVFLFQKEKIILQSLHYIFCSDSYLLKINQDYLKHDFFTDIITFDLSESKEKVSGEIYISLERVKENALLLNTKVSDELLRVVFHGALHLCGYKDKKKTDAKQMRKKEDQYLRLYNKFNLS